MCNQLEIRDIDAKIQEVLKKEYSDKVSGFIRVGAKGYFLLADYRDEAQKVYNMPIRNTDVFVVSYARSGTTVTQELVWLVTNDLDFDGAAATPLTERFTFIEFPMLVPKDVVKSLNEKHKHDPRLLKMLELRTEPGSVQLARIPPTTRRFIKTHLPLALLPPGLLDTARVVYIARDPRDVIVSFYNLNRFSALLPYIADFKTYWNNFINDLHTWAPYFEHLKEAWAQRNHPHLLFLFYEDLVKDMPAAIRQVSKFFDKSFSEDQIARLLDHLSIENFKNNKSVNYEDMKEIGLFGKLEDDKAFIRKGTTGGWSDYFDEEMMKQADEWMEKNLRDTDFRFPHLVNKS